MSVHFFIQILVLVFISTISLTSAGCKYLQVLGNGLQYPLDVCHKYSFPAQNTGGSYKYVCGGNKFHLKTFQDNNCNGKSEQTLLCNGGQDWCGSCMGGTCDHVTLRAYSHQNVTFPGAHCLKDDQSGFWDFALVLGCTENWVSSGARQPSSTHVSCSNHKMGIKEYYNTAKCESAPFWEKSFGAGCAWARALNQSVIPPSLNYTGNLTGNYSYWEVKECGGGTIDWALVITLIAIGICCCGCCAGIVCFCVRRRKQKHAYRQRLNANHESNVNYANTREGGTNYGNTAVYA